jgi:glycerol kinase
VILAIDQGTTGTTCLVFDEQAELIGRAYREFQQHFPRPGWVEHDAAEIWDVTQAVAGEALEDAGVEHGELRAVGITNQRETVCVWDPQTGEPLHRAIVWQDRRTAARCDELREAGHEALIRARTGLVLDPYFSGTKIEWLLNNVDGLREKAERGRAVFGTIDAWLTFKLTGESVTDPSNASRTMLFDITRGEWDQELLELFGVPERALPTVRASSGELGTTNAEALHGHGRPAGGAVRPGVRRSRSRQEHIRHRVVRTPERRLHSAEAGAGPVADSRMEDRGPHVVRA